MKLFKLSEKQKQLCENNVITIGYGAIEKMDNLKNSLKYLELKSYEIAMDNLANIKNDVKVKNALTSNEKSAEMKKLIGQLDNVEIRNACYLLRDKGANKKLLVPIVENYFLQVKAIKKDNKYLTTYILKQNKITCLGSETEDVTLWELTTEKDFFNDIDLLDVKYSDVILAMFSKFSEDKNIPLIEKIEKLKEDVKKANAENKKKVTDYLSVHF